MKKVSSFGLSQRRISRLKGLCRNTLRYQPGPDAEEALWKRMKEIAEQRE